MRKREQKESRKTNIKSKREREIERIEREKPKIRRKRTSRNENGEKRTVRVSEREILCILEWTKMLNLFA